jgi:hypothetical protein
LNIARLLGIVLQYLADLAYRAVNAVVSIEKDVLAPDLLGNLFAGDELTFLHDQNEQDLHGNTLELERTTDVPKLEGSKIDLEILPESDGFLRSGRA